MPAQEYHTRQTSFQVVRPLTLHFRLRIVKHVSSFLLGPRSSATEIRRQLFSAGSAELINQMGIAERVDSCLKFFREYLMAFCTAHQVCVSMKVLIRESTRLSPDIARLAFTTSARRIFCHPRQTVVVWRTSRRDSRAKTLPGYDQHTMLISVNRQRHPDLLSRLPILNSIGRSRCASPVEVSPRAAARL